MLKSKRNATQKVLAEELEDEEKEATKNKSNKSNKSKRKRNKGKGSQPTTKPEEEKRKEKTKIKVKIDPTKSKGKNPFEKTEKHRRNDGPHTSKKKYNRNDTSWKKQAVQAVLLQKMAGDVIDFMEYKRRKEDPSLAKAIKKLQQWEKKNSLSVSRAEDITSSADLQAAYSHGEWVLQKREEEKRKTAYHSTIDIGDGWIIEDAKYKFHRYMNWLKVWDLTDAGRRGKVVTIYILQLPDEGFTGMDEKTLKLVYTLEKAVKRGLKDAKEIGKYMQMVSKLIPPPFREYFERKEKAVRFDPVSTKPIKINGVCEIEATTQEFTVSERKNKGRDVTIISGKGREAKKFYAWATARLADLKMAHLKEIRDQLNKEGIKYKIYYI